MARVSTYLNFPRSTEEAFLFYKSIFGSEFTTPIMRFQDMSTHPDHPPLAEADKNLVMHVELPILGGHVLMGTDAPESMGFAVVSGNNMFINLEPDSRTETDRLFNALSDGGNVEMPLQEMFWCGYFGNLVDRFSVHGLTSHCSRRVPAACAAEFNTLGSFGTASVVPFESKHDKIRVKRSIVGCVIQRR